MFYLNVSITKEMQSLFYQRIAPTLLIIKIKPTIWIRSEKSVVVWRYVLEFLVTVMFLQ